MVKLHQPNNSRGLLWFKGAAVILLLTGTAHIAFVSLFTGEYDSWNAKLQRTVETREKLRAKRLELEDELLQLRALQEQRTKQGHQEQEQQKPKSFWSLF
eukprot:scpid76881/ scgid33280/ 